MHAQRDWDPRVASDPKQPVEGENVVIESIARYLLLAGVAVFVSACAFSNEGAVEFRRAEPYRPNNAAASLKVGASTTSPAAPVYPVPLLRKDISSGELQARIDVKDKVSIRLRDGFLRNCNERMLSPLRGFNKNCEIAILFKAFELGAGQDFNFKPGAEKDARVVYFSNDVQPGQFFNLHNLPVYGPLEYEGRPLGIDIWIIEIDAEDHQSAALLRKLATIGATAHAPAAPVLAVLDQLGSALLASGTDDVEFRYTMVLDPSGGYSGTAYSSAEAGDYVFVREDHRESTTDWHNLQLDHNTGRIWKRTQTGALELYRDNTYLTVQVLRNAGSVDVALAQNTYGEFRAALEKEATTKVAALEPVFTELQKIATRRVYIRNFNRAQQLYERMLERTVASDTRPLAKQDAFDFHRLLQDSINKADGDLVADQVEVLLSKLRTLAMVSTADEMKAFENSKEGFGKITFDQFVKLVVDGPAARQGK